MSGTKRLKSYFFAISNVLRRDGTNGGVRFRTGDIPTQSTYEDLTASSLFSTEPNDKARVYTGADPTLGTEAGHVVLATDAQAKANITQLSDRSLVPQPHQLPTVENSTGNADSITTDVANFTGDALSITVDGSTTTRNKYVAKLSTPFKTWLETVINDLKAMVSDLSAYFKKDGSVAATGDFDLNTHNINNMGNISTGTGVGQLKDSSGNVSLGFNARNLYGNTGGAVLGWSTAGVTLFSNLFQYPYSNGINFDLSSLTSSKTLKIQDRPGTVALLDDIPSGLSFNTTSTTSNTVDLQGPKTFTVPAGLSFKYGNRVRASYVSDPTIFIEGHVTSYTGGTSLTMSVDSAGGTGFAIPTGTSLNNWVISLGGVSHLLTNVTLTATFTGGTAPTVTTSLMQFVKVGGLVFGSIQLSYTGGSGTYTNINLSLPAGSGLAPFINNMFGHARFASSDNITLFINTDVTGNGGFNIQTPSGSTGISSSSQNIAGSITYPVSLT